jgi:SHS2 domain-containing protein
LYRWIDHTAEVELAIEGENERQVLEEGLLALAELLGFAAAHGGDERTLVLEAPDRPALLAGWLEELVFLAESEGFVATELQSLELGSGRLEAVVTGLLDEPPPLVKAVTYHGLRFERRAGGYFASVVLDV